MVTLKNANLTIQPKPSRGSLAYTRAHSTRIIALCFLIPLLIVVAVYIIYPIINTFITSTYKWNGINASKTFIALRNWEKLINDASFWNAFKNNLIVMVCSIILQMPIGIAMATFLDAGGRKLNIFKTVWFFPFLMSSTAIGFLFSYVLSTHYGMLTEIATLFAGKETYIDLLGQYPQALYAIIFVMAWQFSPFYMVYFIAGYSGIEISLYEASIIDGATRFQYIKSIAFPLLMPTIKAACTMSLIGSLKYFDLVWNMTQGGPGTATDLMATYMYKVSFHNYNMGYGSCVAAGMFILITIIALIFQKIFVIKENY
jgi:raffinose/stachyose/melibiose transport system permease protein